MTMHEIMLLLTKFMHQSFILLEIEICIEKIILFFSRPTNHILFRICTLKIHLVLPNVNTFFSEMQSSKIFLKLYF